MSKYKNLGITYPHGSFKQHIDTWVIWPNCLNIPSRNIHKNSAKFDFQVYNLSAQNIQQKFVLVYEKNICL